MRPPAALFFGEDCLPEAFKHLKGERALIVTDEPLVRLGYVDRVHDLLRKRGFRVEVFDSVEPDPTIESALQGVSRMRAFKPDVIVAFGGGSPIDCAKVMKLLFLHPEMSFEKLRMVFMDITKRVMRFPDASVDAFALPLVAIPTTSGTGAEVTPFAVIRDGATGKKYPLADYAMTPQTAIIDPVYAYSMPKTLAAYTGYDALTHAVEAYVSVLASEFTKPMALRAIQLLHKSLVRSFETAEHEARREVHYASTIAGYAFGNCFVGIAHSLAHQIGARYDLPHGVACALTLPEVVKFNACDAPTRQAIFPQYKFPHAKEAYAEIATHIGLTGTVDEKVDKFVQELISIRAKLLIPASIKEAVRGKLVDSDNDYSSKAQLIAREAFDDQCTLSNPRYPLISELKTILDTVYHGEASTKSS
jgi:acetaldehyde dehydrogenase/alcohol dehydrogenase